MDIRQKYLKQIPVYKDWPKEGVDFYDVFPLISNDISRICDELSSLIFENIHQKMNFWIAGIESRGFVLGMALAKDMGLPFIPIRKAGKLPKDSDIVQIETTNEYDDCVKLETYAEKKGNLLIVDDVVATGNTLRASSILCTKAGWNVIGSASILTLSNVLAHDICNHASLIEL